VICEKNQESEIYNKFLEIVNKTKTERPADLLVQDIKRDSQWYKDEIIYMFYPERFGVEDETTPNTFRNLTGMLDYLNDLGVTILYILPFHDYSSCNEEFVEFVFEAKARGFKIQINYPCKLDLKNWKNPEVLYYMLDIMGQWANNGIDILRLDAIPCFNKIPESDNENIAPSPEVIKLLSAFLQLVAPGSIIQAEACCKWPQDIFPYFGEEQKIDLGANQQTTRTEQVQIAHNFLFTQAVWANLITADKKHFWEAFNLTPKIPDSASWSIFLGSQDELSLDMLDAETGKIIHDNLVLKGAEFKKDLGVSGRMLNFLDKDLKKISLAFSILFSLPGIPIIYYGDEAGVSYNWKYAEDSAEKREFMQEENGEKDLNVMSYFDSRDINRGPVKKEIFYNAMKEDKNLENKIYKTVKNLVRARKENPSMSRGSITEAINGSKCIFSYTRETDLQKVLVINNLSEKSVNEKIELPVHLINKADKSLFDLISGEKIRVKANYGSLEVSLKPYQSLWLQFC